MENIWWNLAIVNMVRTEEEGSRTSTVQYLVICRMVGRFNSMPWVLRR